MRTNTKFLAAQRNEDLTSRDGTDAEIRAVGIPDLRRSGSEVEEAEVDAEDVDAVGERVDECGGER